MLSHQVLNVYCDKVSDGYIEMFAYFKSILEAKLDFNVTFLIKCAGCTVIAKICIFFGNFALDLLCFVDFVAEAVATLSVDSIV